METRNDSWPFLVPVEKKKFPGYHRVIKKPMDFQTMRNKLDEGRSVIKSLSRLWCSLCQCASGRYVVARDCSVCKVVSLLMVSWANVEAFLY